MLNFQIFILTMIRILKLIEIFENKDKYMLIKRKIVMFDYYMRFPFMTDEERDKQNFDEKYAFYFWKPNYALYDAVLTILVSKEFVSCEEGSYSINKKGKTVLEHMDCEYMKTLEEAGKYVLNTVTKMSEKGQKKILSKNQIVDGRGYIEQIIYTCVAIVWDKKKL